jgi:hypothetical protein
VTFDPVSPLLDDQQYVITFTPGGVFDLVGNSIAGVHTIVFSTGSALETGTISGTVSGYPGSEASDPTGAFVFALDRSIFQGDFNILAVTKVAANDTYSLTHLGDGAYYIVAVLALDGDEEAMGGYGVNFDGSDLDPDSVVIAGGAHVGDIDFALFDPSTVSGTVTYSGSFAEGAAVYVGLFDAVGFDPQNPGEPVLGTSAYWPTSPDWIMSTLGEPVPMGDYYVGAFLDANINGFYDVGEDPAGLYGGISSPTSIHLMSGSDFSGLTITLVDPLPGSPAITVAWRPPAHGKLPQRLNEFARRGQ